MKITPTKRGFNIQHTTREVWGVDDDDAPTITGSHYDYVHQAWTQDGKYVRCGHPAAMDCGCYGKLHEGETANPNDLPTA